MDSTWEEMTNLCKLEFSQCSNQQELVKLCGNDEKIAWVVYFHNRDNSLKWMRSKVPALNGKTPTSCFPDNVNLLKRILLSFPS